MTREELLNAVMTRPETVRIKGHDFRKLDLAALAALSELGNPLADISGDVESATRRMTISAVAEAVFVCAAPRALVAEAVYRHGAAAAREAAAEFCRRFNAGDLPEIMAALTAGVAEIRAAEASAIPDDAPAASKNAPGPAAS